MVIKYTRQYYNFVFSEKIKGFFFFSVALFFSFFVLGLLFAHLNKEESFLMFEALSEKYLFAVDYGFWKLFHFILKNNITIAIFAYVSGLVFGLPTFFVLLVNSFVIGLIVRVAESEMSILLILGSTLPHGIFEIPAILGAFAAGFYVGISVFLFLFKGKNVLTRLEFSLRYFMYFVVPFLVIAAFVESALISFLPK